MERNVNVIKDIYGNNIVVINDIRFKGKRSVKWNDVKKYLEKFIGEFYEIADTKDIVYIGSDLPDEYTGSKYTYSLKGTAAKAKANAAQGIPEMLLDFCYVYLMEYTDVLCGNEGHFDGEKTSLAKFIGQVDIHMDVMEETYGDNQLSCLAILVQKTAVRNV